MKSKISKSKQKRSIKHKRSIKRKRSIKSKRSIDSGVPSKEQKIEYKKYLETNFDVIVSTIVIDFTETDFKIGEKFESILKKTLDDCRNAIIFIALRRQIKDDDTEKEICHSNLMFVDKKSKKFILFEPHGSNPELKEHGRFQNFYNASIYFKKIKELITKIVEEDVEVITPDEYEPEFFLQSYTNDHYCYIWSMVFTYCLLSTKETISKIFSKLINIKEDTSLPLSHLDFVKMFKDKYETEGEGKDFFKKFIATLASNADWYKKYKK